MIKRMAIVGALFTFATVMVGCGAPQDNKKTSSAFTVPKWQSFPVEIYVDQRLANDPMALSDVKAALNYWEQKTSRPLFIFRGEWDGQVALAADGTIDPLNTPVNDIMHESPWPYSPGMLAVTVNLQIGGTIARSIISINDGFQFCYGECVLERGISFRKVLTHEVGHFIGLGHNPDPSNIMYTFYQSNLGLNQLKIDWNALAQVLP